MLRIEFLKIFLKDYKNLEKWTAISEFRVPIQSIYEECGYHSSLKSRIRGDHRESDPVTFFLNFIYETNRVKYIYQYMFFTLIPEILLVFLVWKQLSLLEDFSSLVFRTFSLLLEIDMFSISASRALASCFLYQLLSLIYLILYR